MTYFTFIFSLEKNHYAQILVQEGRQVQGGMRDAPREQSEGEQSARYVREASE